MHLLEGFFFNKIIYFPPLFCIAATHQKGFILYLGSSHLTFFLTLKIYDVIWPLLNEQQMWSYRRKVAIFFFSVASLLIMVYFYYRHFIHCDAFGKNLGLAVQRDSLPGYKTELFLLHWVHFSVKLNFQKVPSFYIIICWPRFLSTKQDIACIIGKTAIHIKSWFNYDWIGG